MRPPEVGNTYFYVVTEAAQVDKVTVCLPV